MSTHVDQHLERFLGPIAKGWSPVGGPAHAQVCLFPEKPSSGAITYATLGLSHHILSMPKGRMVRQELLLVTRARFERDDLPSLAFYVADGMVHEHRAILRGEILPLGYPVISGSSCTALYVSLPILFPDAFSTFDGTDPLTVFVWLVPITEREVEFTRAQGWSAFEDMLEQCGPDLLDLDRESIV